MSKSFLQGYHSEFHGEQPLPCQFLSLLFYFRVTYTMTYNWLPAYLDRNLALWKQVCPLKNSAAGMNLYLPKGALLSRRSPIKTTTTYRDKHNQLSGGHCDSAMTDTLTKSKAGEERASLAYSSMLDAIIWRKFGWKFKQLLHHTHSQEQRGNTGPPLFLLAWGASFLYFPTAQSPPV